VIFVVLRHWIPEVRIDSTIAMAENDSSEILPYHFEPMSVSTNDSADESDSSESEIDIREQASFMERLGSTSWCVCAKCTPMPSGIECQCCREMEGVSERITENESCQCITDHEQFKVMCLNKDVLYTALVMMNTIRGDPLGLPLPNKCVMATVFLIVHINCILYCRSYRLAAYRQFINWTHSKLGKGIRKVIPSCAVVAIQHEFPEPENTYTGFKIYHGL